MPAPRLNFDKLIDKWIYKYEGALPGEDSPVIGDRVVEIEVRLCKQNRESSAAPHPTDSTWFEVRCSSMNLRYTGTDIEVLRKAVWAELDKAFEIKWESWYLVRVDPARPYQGDGGGLVFSYDDVWKGIAHDGTELLKERCSRYNWRISAWPGEFKDKNGRVIACIPATKANTQALEAFTEGVAALRKKMADYLRPETIQHTLANLAGVPFLTPPAEKGDDCAMRP